MDVVTADDFLYLGLRMVGWNLNKLAQATNQTKLNKWKVDFVPSPDVCSKLYNDVRQHILNSQNPESNTPTVSDIIMSIYWLSNYPILPVLARIWKLSEKTCRNRLKNTISLIQALKQEKIKWIWNENQTDEIFILTVDGTHCPIKEPRKDPSSQWFSHKFNGPALAYEVAISIFHNKVVWINGPFKAGESDRQIFRKPGGLKEKIPLGKIVVADKGYTGEPQIISTPNPYDTNEIKKFKNRARARQETFNARLKRFAVLADRFRHGTKNEMAFHKSCFEACCILCQYEIETSNPLFTV